MNKERRVAPSATKQDTDCSRSRRRLFKLLAAGGGSVASVTFAPKWVKPLVEAVALPAHAQATLPATLTYCQVFFTTPQGGSGPAAMRCVVDTVTGIASVEAVNRYMNVVAMIDLNINGTPSNSFGGSIDASCGGDSLPGAQWSIVGYTLGDPTISILSDGEGTWTRVLPLGDCVLPATCPVIPG